MQLTRTPTVQDLVQAARADDSVALGELLHRYANYLSILATTQLDGKLRGRVSPSDIVQETYTDAARDFGQFRGTSEGEFAAWLRQILIQNLGRAVERHILTAKRDVRRELSMDQLQRAMARSSARLDRLFADPGPTPSRASEQHQRGRVIADILARLPADYREVVLLRNFRGLPFREVADRLQRSEGAVRMLWLRALDRLREYLHETDA